jgi:hypothetical protein
VKASSWCTNCDGIKFLYDYVDAGGNQQMSMLVVMDTDLVDCRSAGLWCRVYWEIDGVDGPGFVNGYDAGPQTKDEWGRVVVTLIHNASRFPCCNTECGPVLLEDFLRIPENALPLEVVFSEAAAYHRSKLPDSDSESDDAHVPGPEWAAWLPGPHHPCIPGTPHIGAYMDITMFTGWHPDGPPPKAPPLHQPAPIRLDAGLFHFKWCSTVQLLSRIVVHYKLTPSHIWGELSKMPPHLEVFVHDDTVDGPLGTKGRQLEGQRGCKYIGEEPLPRGWPLVAYPGIVCKEDSREGSAAVASGEAFQLDWGEDFPDSEGPSWILAPDGRNIAKFANDPSRNLHGKRNRYAALDVNAVFVTLYIWGVPVPMLVTVREIRPGQQIVLEYGVRY